MWVVALLGMLTKCVEVTLGQYYRVKGEDGVYYGGPMYYIERGMAESGNPWPSFSLSLSFWAAWEPLRSPSPIPCPPLCRTAWEFPLGLPPWRRPSSAAWFCWRRQVHRRFLREADPAMCLIYVVGVLGVIIINLEHVPAAFAAIFPAMRLHPCRCGRFGGLHSALARGRAPPRDLLQRSGLRLIAHHPCDRHHRSPL